MLSKSWNHGDILSLKSYLDSWKLPILIVSILFLTPTILQIQLLLAWKKFRENDFIKVVYCCFMEKLISRKLGLKLVTQQCGSGVDYTKFFIIWELFREINFTVGLFTRKSVFTEINQKTVLQFLKLHTALHCSFSKVNKKNFSVFPQTQLLWWFWLWV